MKSIPINNSPFAKTGATGRMRYFVNSLLMAALTFVLPLVAVVLIKELSGGSLEAIGWPALIAPIPFGLPGFYFGIKAETKRMTDIYNEDMSKSFWSAFVLRVIPIVNICFWLYLLFMPGQVTAPNKVKDLEDKFEKGLSATSSIAKKTKDTISNTVKGKIQEIANEGRENKSSEEKLLELKSLKDKGLISEAEYEDGRKNILDKVS